jgi:CHAT domain-containing protein
MKKRNSIRAGNAERATALPALVLLALLAITTPPSRAQSQEVKPAPNAEEHLALAPGQAISAEMRPGQKRRYRVSVGGAGHFFRLALRSADLKLRMVISDPAGLSVRESVSRTFGANSLSWISAAKGDHQIEIGEDSGEGGVYEISLEENRPQEPRDVTRLNAEQALSEADRMTGRGDKLPAIEKFWEQSLAGWRALQDARAVGEALIAIGWACDRLNKEERARDYFNQAVFAWRALNDNAGLAEAELGLACANVRLGDVVAGIAGFTRASELWRAVNDLKGQARSLIPLAAAQVQFGEGQSAIDLYSQALELFRRLNRPKGEAMALNGLAWAYYEMGDDRNAIDTAKLALRIVEGVDSKYVEEQTHTTIGQAYARLGEYQPALDHSARALAISRATDDQLQQVVSLKEVGSVYEKLGDRRQALDYYQQALSLARSLKYRQGEAEALNCVGYLYELNGDRQRALEAYLTAWPICRDTRNRVEEIRSLHHLAHVLRDLGSLDQSRERIESAIELIESSRAQVGSRRMRESYFATVQKSYELYIDVLMQLHRRRPADGLDRRALHLSEKARARSLSEMLAEAHVDLRRDAPPELFAQERELRQLLNAKAELQTKSLESPDTHPQAEALAGEIRRLDLAYEDIQVKIRKAVPAYMALTQPAALSCEDIQQMALDGQTALLEYALGDERSYGWLVTRDKVFSYELPPRTVIEKAARSVYELLTVRQPRANETAAQHAERLSKALAEKVDERFWRESSALSRMIIGPGAAELTRPRLLVIGDGALQYLPFSVLPDPLPSAQPPGRAAKKPSAGLSEEPPTPLLVKYEVVHLPSATTLAALRREMAGRQPVPKSIAVVADPVFGLDDWRFSRPPQGDQNNPLPSSAMLAERRTRGIESGVQRLPSSGKDVELISQLVDPALRFLATGFEAKRSLIESRQLSEYRIVHLSTHGTLNAEQPELSSLVFSLFEADGTRLDGWLRMRDVYKLRLPAELVVLSACETALGKEVKGEGLIALTRGFMYAGAPRVIASLWKVDDNATAELMQQFYRRLLHQKQVSPVAALRQAQLELWRKGRYRAPYYWAAFVLQGEYQSISLDW